MHMHTKFIIFTHTTGATSGFTKPVCSDGEEGFWVTSKLMFRVRLELLNVGGAVNVPSVAPLNGVSYNQNNVYRKKKCILCTVLSIKHSNFNVVSH